MGTHILQRPFQGTLRLHPSHLAGHEQAGSHLSVLNRLTCHGHHPWIGILHHLLVCLIRPLFRVAHAQPVMGRAPGSVSQQIAKHHQGIVIIPDDAKQIIGNVIMIQPGILLKRFHEAYSAPGLLHARHTHPGMKQRHSLIGGKRILLSAHVAAHHSIKIADPAFTLHALAVFPLHNILAAFRKVLPHLFRGDNALAPQIMSILVNLKSNISISISQNFFQPHTQHIGTIFLIS